MPITTERASATRARKVLGTSVTDTSGNRIGKIEDVVLDGRTDNVLFAIVGFRGLPEMSEMYHPIPWSCLDYDPAADAYVVGFSREKLRAAPAGSIDELTRGDGLLMRDQTYDYYKTPRYWE